MLRVSTNGRFLTDDKGVPFLWLADTAWELFHRLTCEEAEWYLNVRAQQGFTVIQAVALAELDGLNAPNPYGETPLLDNNPEMPNESYFQHVDWIISKAADLGLYIGLLPTWGDKLFTDAWGIGPEIFNEANAYAYGKWMGNRYRNWRNICWIVGGDRNPRENYLDVAVWRAMAKGLLDGMGKRRNALITFHPQPSDRSSSSTWFHQDNWLDFNMLQTGHCRTTHRAELIRRDYNLEPTKPTLDGEPIYEEHPVCFNAEQWGYSTAHDVRQALFSTLFAGACGCTYGCHSVWQMWVPGKHKGVNAPLHVWNESLYLPGATAVRHLKWLLSARPFAERTPDQSLLLQTANGPRQAVAIRGVHYAMVYSPFGEPFTVVLGKITGETLQAHWFDPRTGALSQAGTVTNGQTRSFTPPSSGYDNDWVLLLDDTKSLVSSPNS